MLWQILGIVIIIILIVFFAFTLRILFVFVKGIRKNSVLNKSIAKNVFTGKLSLSIILFFFMISFGLVGGMQLMSTSGSRTLEKQFNENSLFQAETTSYTLPTADPLKTYAARFYVYKLENDELENEVEFVSYSFVNDLLIKYTLAPETIDHFNDDNFNFNDIELLGSESETANPDDVFKNAFPIPGNENIFKDLNQDTIGWSVLEWEYALEWQLINTTSDWEINKILGGGTTFLDLMVNTFFDSDFTKLGKMIFQYRIFTNPIPVERNNLPENAKATGIVNSFIDELSFKITSYVNATPLNAQSGIDFMFVIINDINFSQDDNAGQAITSTSDDKFIKFSEDEREINELTFIDGVSSLEEFRGLSHMNRNQEIGLVDQSYNVVVQEDFLIAKNISVGETIKFGDSNTEFCVSGSVRFNEVTYPLMGTNLLPDKTKQAFIGINLSDFLLFIQNNQYISVISPQMKIFYGLDSIYEELNNLKDWTKPYSSIWIDFSKKMMDFSSSVTYLNNSYNIDPSDILKQTELWSLNSDGKVDTEYITEILTEYDYYYKYGNFMGWGTEMKSYTPLPQWGSQESLRAMMGPTQILNLKTMLNILIGIFLFIVLIVLAMLISKRIKSSSKQLGTLKAMGMKNSNISSSYIIYPIIIITLGFLLASIISPIVMMTLTNLFSQYYYITFSATAISLQYFISLLFIPLILSVSMIYIMSLWTLRRSTLDLLTNKTNNAPNILVRTIGYVTPMKTPFAVTYVTKGLFRAMGKSSLLFISIFLATLLSAFAMSSSTMIQKQTDEIMEYLNFDYLQMGVIENKGQYNMEPLYSVDANGDPILNNNGEYKFEYEESLTAIEIDPIEIDLILDIFKNLKLTPASFKDVYKKINEIIFSPFYENDSLRSSNLFNTYYFTDEYMEILFLSNIILNFVYSSSVNDESTFSEWESEYISSNNFANDLIAFSNTKKLLEPWAFQVATNMNKSGTGDSLISTIKGATSDLVFGTYYYDQYFQVTYGYTTLNNKFKAINSPYHYKYDEIIDDLDFSENGSSLLMLEDKQSFINFYGSMENKIGESLWNESFAKYFLEDGSTAVKNLDYIPVVASTQSVLIMDQWVKDGVATKNNNVYTVSVNFNVLQSNINSPEIKYRTNESILIDLKVESEVFLGLDFGLTTIKPLFNSYLNNYNYDDNDLLIYNSDYKGYVFKKNGNEFIIWGDGYSTAFTSNSDQIATISHNNNGNDDMPRPGDENFRASPASFVLTVDGEKSSGESPMTFGQLLYDSEHEQSNPGISTGINYTNGISISIDSLLDQGAVAYEMIISIFAIISLFSIFISTTIIIIAMKDIIDSSKREVSMLKAFGYSNTKSTILIMMPYLFVMILAVAISIPLTFSGLAILATVFTTLTGNAFVFTLSFIQWVLLLGYVTLLSLLLLFLGYVSFSRTDALEAIKETDE